MVSDRRRSPRILIDPPIRARVVELDADVAITEASFGGFLVKSPMVFERNVEYEFLLVGVGGSETIRVEATALHCRVVSTERMVLFETGFAFTNGSRSMVGLEAFLGSVLSVLETS